ncbi:MAG: class I SAM-dependent methyltransferase [Candidatus Hodarchaeales archaeon]|jgi:ubiquinone/menaquinone biosynthesis C-methylase UbiE
MEFVTRATPLYEFLRLCNNTNLERKVLDCGAGGRQPPLYLFHQHGYKTFGIDISEHAIKNAEDFCKTNNLNIDLNIRLGDMRRIDFEDENFPFVYSYNTITHMSKKDIIKAMKEIERVLVPNGFCYVNFTSEDSELGNRGEKIGEGEYLLPVGDNETDIHSFHTDDEADAYFTNFELLHKEKGLLYRYEKGKVDFILGEINYIGKKL